MTFSGVYTPFGESITTIEPYPIGPGFDHPGVYYIDETTIGSFRGLVPGLSEEQRQVYSGKLGADIDRLEILSNRTVAMPENIVGRVEVHHHGALLFPGAADKVTKFQARCFNAELKLVSVGRTEVIGDLFSGDIRLDQVQCTFVYGTKMQIQQCTLRRASDSELGIHGESIYIGDLSSPEGEQASIGGDQIFVKRLDRFTGFVFEESEQPGEIMIGLLTENAEVSFETLPETKVTIYACQNDQHFPSNVEIIHRNMPTAEVSERDLDTFFAKSSAFRQLFPTQSMGLHGTKRRKI
jgi:hypothetical protein